MSQTRHHVIRRECIDLAVEGGESEGFALQGKLAALCQGELAAALDQVLSRAAPGNEHWQFERIEVDAGHFTPETFERDFATAVAAAVEEQIRTRKAQAIVQPDIATDAGDVRMTGAQSIHEAFLHFLATGVLPWWCHLPEGQTLEAAVSEAWGEAPGQGGPMGLPLRAALLRVLASPVTRLRLARQCSTEFLERMLERLAPGTFAILRDLVAAVDREVSIAMPSGLPEHVWTAAFACLASHQTITPRHVLDEWAALVPGLITPALVERIAGMADGASALTNDGVDNTIIERRDMTLSGMPTNQGNDTATYSIGDAASIASVAPATEPLDLQEGVFIDCAGVVLLHPFLPRLFERLNVTVDDRLVQPDRALALLHFLATGQASAPEYALALPKLLCGLEPSALAGAPVVLSEADRKEAESLLQAAIEHWSSIGQTSHDGLRGNFLVRPGKLSKRGDDDQLQVEKRTWDILLAQLPWGIGVVRLPWMQRMLWVDWPY
jgi:hypothetical protein